MNLNDLIRYSIHGYNVGKFLGIATQRFVRKESIHLKKNTKLKLYENIIIFKLNIHLSFFLCVIFKS